jgi:hypothetical protein
MLVFFFVNIYYDFLINSGVKHIKAVSYYEIFDQLVINCILCALFDNIYDRNEPFTKKASSLKFIAAKVS